jgi:hypothetical protein
VRFDLLLDLCALHSFGFALFHAAFWKLFRWPQTLAAAGVANRAIIQIANLRLIYLFLGVAALCVIFPQELRATALGHAVLLGMSAFWVGRSVEQFVFLRINHPGVHALTALFVIGAVLFALPLFV